MNHFAKLFTFSEHQVLVVVEYNDDEDFYELIQTTRIKGIQVELKLSFRDEWVAQGALHDYGEDNAQQFLERMRAVHQTVSGGGEGWAKLNS